MKNGSKGAAVGREGRKGLGMRAFKDGTYQGLLVVTLLSFLITLENCLTLCYAVRILLVLAVLAYVSFAAFRSPESRAQYPLRYLQYFWLTAAMFGLCGFLTAWGYEIPDPLVTGLFAAFPLASVGLVVVRPAYKVVIPYICVQAAFLLALLLDF